MSCFGVRHPEGASVSPILPILRDMRRRPLHDSTRSTRLIFPEALAEGLNQSEFNPFVHGFEVGGRGRPRSRKGRCVARLEAAPPTGRAPARPPRARCPRPQGQMQRIDSWQCDVIGASTIGTTGQPVIRPSDSGRDKARPARRD